MIDIRQFKKLIVIGVALGALLFGSLTIFYIVTRSERTTSSITFSLDGIDSAELINTSTKSTVRVIKDGDTIPLPTGSKDYRVHYKGSEKYSDGQVSVDTLRTNITIRADYSKDTLKQLYDKEKTAIEQTLNMYAPSLAEHFRVEDGSLYGRGEWYAAKLTYTGDKLTNRDNVVIVLHKNEGDWAVYTDPPLPSVSILEGKDVQIPEHIRAEMNKKLFD